jgi:putative DNA primase/helicase
MPASLLAGDGTQYRAQLLAMGLRIGAGTAAKNHLTVYIQTQQTDVRVRCTDRIGWHDDVYVLPDQTIGEGEEKVIFQAAGGVVSQFKQRGTLDEWRDEVAKHCRGNSRMVFCVSAAFAAPLLHLARVPSGGFHIWGDSSSGKSTAFKVAGSVFGGKDYPRNWRMTDNALETVAAQHSDALLLLDEIAQVDPKVVADIVYMLGNETGKGRATQTALARRVATWRLLFLSDGEVSLANHMEQAGKGAKAGLDVRMAHIAADAGHGMGVYETLNGFPSGAALSDHLVSKAHLHYGTAGMAFIEYAVENAATLSDVLQGNVAQLAGEWCPVDSHGQVSRVATRFALVGIAGELASSAGITGWEAGEAMAAARQCFTAWLEGRGGAGNVEHVSILRQVSGFFQAHGDSRFTWWHRAADDHKPNTINRAGFRRLITADGMEIKSDADHMKAYGDKVHPKDAEETSQEYFVLPEVFRNEICKGFNPKTVTRLLIERGLLMSEGDGATRSERVPGQGKIRVYRFKPEIVSIDL